MPGTSLGSRPEGAALEREWDFGGLGGGAGGGL